MEGFSQEDVDRLIQEAAQSAKQKSGVDMDFSNPSPKQNAKDAKAAPAASKKEAPAATPAKKEAEKPVQKKPEPVAVEEPVVEEPKDEVEKPQEAAQEVKSDEPEKPAEVAEDTPSATETPVVSNEPGEESLTTPAEEPVEEILDTAEPEQPPESSTPQLNDIQDVPVEENPVNTINCEEVKSFILDTIQELARTKLELAKINIDLEIEQLKDKVNNLLK